MEPAGGAGVAFGVLLPTVTRHLDKPGITWDFDHGINIGSFHCCSAIVLSFFLLSLLLALLLFAVSAAILTWRGC